MFLADSVGAGIFCVGELSVPPVWADLCETTSCIYVVAVDVRFPACLGLCGASADSGNEAGLEPAEIDSSGVWSVDVGLFCGSSSGQR